MDATDRMGPAETGRPDRRTRTRRSLAVIGAAGGLAVGLAGCHGTPVPTSIDVTMSCVEVVLGQAPTPLPDETMHVELSAPTWADTGRSLPLEDLIVTGAPLPDMELEFASVTTTGLEPFRQFFDAPYEDTFFGAAASDGVPADLGSATVWADGPVGSDATVDLAGVSFVDSGTSPSYGASCRPKPGEPTRLATIRLRQPDTD